MHLYDYTPPKDTQRTTAIIICLSSLGAAPFLFSLILQNIPFKWAFQLISILMLTAVIFIVTRYVAKSYTYSIIENEDRSRDFTVTEIGNGGRSKITVCRIAVDSIESLTVIDRSVNEDAVKLRELKKAAKKEERKFFSYYHTVNPPKLCIVFAEECGEKFLISFTPDEKLISFLEPKQQ